jgi:hypothetical protein
MAVHKIPESEAGSKHICFHFGILLGTSTSKWASMFIYECT